MRTSTIWRAYKESVAVWHGNFKRTRGRRRQYWAFEAALDARITEADTLRAEYDALYGINESLLEHRKELKMKNLELIEDNRRLMRENEALRRKLQAAAVGYKDKVEVLVRRKR